MKPTKKDYQEYLNDIGEDLLEESFIIGGKLRRGRYGDLIRKHDPMAFQVGFNEFKEELNYQK